MPHPWPWPLRPPRHPRRSPRRRLARRLALCASARPWPWHDGHAADAAAGAGAWATATHPRWQLTHGSGSHRGLRHPLSLSLEHPLHLTAHSPSCAGVFHVEHLRWQCRERLAVGWGPLGDPLGVVQEGTEPKQHWRGCTCTEGRRGTFRGHDYHSVTSEHRTECKIEASLRRSVREEMPMWAAASSCVIS